jgi:hypothetical protein
VLWDYVKVTVGVSSRQLRPIFLNQKSDVFNCTL